MGKINDESIDTVKGEDKFLMERAEAEEAFNKEFDKQSNNKVLKQYMHDLAMRSVKLQKKLYGKKKFSDMGKASVIVRRAKREENMRKKLDSIGEAVDFQLK